MSWPCMDAMAMVMHGAIVRCYFFSQKPITKYNPKYDSVKCPLETGKIIIGSIEASKQLNLTFEKLF